MAHEMTEADGLVTVGQPAWHGLGVVVPDAVSPVEALDVAGLDWSVESVPVFGERSTFKVSEGGEFKESTERLDVDSHRLNVRSDNGEVLGVVGSGYKAVQNRDLAALIYAAAESEDVKVETFGSFKGGRVVYACARLSTFELPGRDRVHLYGLFSNAHDGSRALWVLPTSVRVVCCNTHSWAVGAARNLTVKLRHTSGIMGRVDDVRAILKGARDVSADVEGNARKLEGRKMDGDELRKFYAEVWSKLYGAIPAGLSLDKSERRKRSRAVDMVSAWSRRADYEANGLGVDRSAWLAVNAVGWWLDHKRISRGDRMHSNIMGTAADDKAAAYRVAGELIATA